jgi:hypothetical protein
VSRRVKAPREVSPSEQLEYLVQQAIAVTRTARKHRKRLDRDNFYADKLIQLRANAVNVFRDLSAQTVGDTSALAEMIGAVFSPGCSASKRAAIARELIFSLRTTWRKPPGAQVTVGAETLFPPSILAETKRGYLTSIGRQMNECFAAGWFDASAVMLRRLLEVSIIEAFESASLANKIKDQDGDYLQLTALIDRALGDSPWSLSRHTRRYLPQLRDLGHLSAHGRYFSAKREDIERVRQGCRVTIEEFLHHARLIS